MKTNIKIDAEKSTINITKNGEWLRFGVEE